MTHALRTLWCRQAQVGTEDTLHHITLRYVTSRYITVHYITLHYITLHYMLHLNEEWYGSLHEIAAASVEQEETAVANTGGGVVQAGAGGYRIMRCPAGGRGLGVKSECTCKQQV